MNKFQQKATKKEKMCTQKRTYKTEKDAERTVNRMLEELEVMSTYYQCSFCKKYHIKKPEEEMDGE